MKVAVLNRDGNVAFVEKNYFERELASVADGKPYALVKSLVGDLETQPLNIGPKEHLDG